MKSFEKLIFTVFFSCFASAAFSQEANVVQSITLQGSISQGQTPLWLNANKNGLSALTAANGYLGYEVEGTREFEFAENRKVKLAVGANLVAPVGYRYQGKSEHYTSHFIFQEFFADVQYKNVYLSVGAKERPLTFRDDRLSSGSMTFGKNARPVPQVRFGLVDFWNIPGLNDWVAIKGHLSVGVMTDGEWEATFTSESGNKYNRLARYHEKAGYLRIGKEDRPFSVIGGLEMAAQFGGYLYSFRGANKVKLSSNFNSYKNAILCITSADYNEDVYQNNEGNLLGGWVIRTEWKQPSWKAGFYFNNYFEDHSAMFFLDYDGYGSGDEWNVKKDRRFFVYDLRDFQLGCDLELKQSRWVRNITLEYLNTTYQSGPIYHDHNQTWSDHVCGVDNYYNHSSLPGWQHWGQVIGNPLFISPQYNRDGNIGTVGNRFRAWHLGIGSNTNSLMSYRALLTYEKNWGTYYKPFLYPREGVSLLLEGTATLHANWLPQPLFLTVAYGQDWGKLWGNHCGVQVSIKYVIR